MVIGSLMTVLCGGCTATFGLWTLVTSALHPDSNGPVPFSVILFAVIVIGVLPTATGVGLFLLGRWLSLKPGDSPSQE